MTTPRIRASNGSWLDTDWDTALSAAAKGLQAASAAGNAADLGFLAHPSSTLEELYLLGRVAQGVGSANIDHRLRQRDFRDQSSDSGAPGLGMPLAEVDALDALFIVGANLRAEIPMLAHRVRKAAGRGARVSLLQPAPFKYLFPVAHSLTSPPSQMVSQLAGVLQAALTAAGAAASGALAPLLAGVTVNDSQRAIASSLTTGRRAIWLGALALRHSAYAELRLLARELAQVTGATIGELLEGANSTGAYLAGCVPHRDPAGQVRAASGMNVREMLERPLRGYLLLGTEPWADGGQPQSLVTLENAPFVVAVTAFASEDMKRVAHILLPAGTFAETSGTYVNLEGRWQSLAVPRERRVRRGRRGKSCGCWEISWTSPTLTISPRNRCAMSCARRWTRRRRETIRAATALRQTTSRRCATCRCTRSIRCCVAPRLSS